MKPINLGASLTSRQAKTSGLRDYVRRELGGASREGTTKLPLLESGRSGQTRDLTSNCKLRYSVNLTNQ